MVLGNNDAKVPLLDERTGGCSDGLTCAGRSRNQGAESTLAMISVPQQGHRFTAARQAAEDWDNSPSGRAPGRRRN